MNSILQQLYHHLMQQQKEMEHLKKTIQNLEREIQHLKERPAMVVEKIEYKFDQLKVENLEGTLNIGLNPADLGEMEEVSLPREKNEKTHEQYQKIKKNIEKEILKRMDDVVYTTIQDTEIQNSQLLHSQYKELIKQDIIRQLPSRIDFYMKQFEAHPQLQRNEQIEEFIIKALINDIQQGIQRFISQIPNFNLPNENENDKEEP